MRVRCFDGCEDFDGECERFLEGWVVGCWFCDCADGAVADERVVSRSIDSEAIAFLRPYGFALSLSSGSILFPESAFSWSMANFYV